MHFTNKKILITGAAGFIGSKLTEKLVKMGVSPSVLVRDRANISSLTKIKEKISIYEIDITKYENLNNIIKQINPEIVFHLAAYGVYNYTNISYENINTMINSNVQGTINLLYALKSSQCKIIINTGSCFEYGTSNYPFKENDNLSPCNIYGYTKVSSTFIAHQLAKNFDIKINTLRPFNAYGPESSNTRFITTAVNACLNNHDIQIPDAEIIRDFVYIEDIIEAYLMALQNKDFRNDLIINISSNKGTNLEEIINMIKNLIPSKSRVQKGAFPIRTGEVLSLIGSNKLAKEYLKWHPRYSLKQGLKLHILSLKNN